MTEPASIPDVINLWPARKDLASEISVPVDRVHKWAQNAAIPAKFHLSVIESAARRGFPVTADLLARLHDPRNEGHAA